MRYISAALVVVLSGCGDGQPETATPGPVSLSPTLVEGTPAEVGMSSEHLTDAIAIFRRAVVDGSVTGVQLLVARKGRVGWLGAVFRLTS